MSDFAALSLAIGLGVPLLFALSMLPALSRFLPSHLGDGLGLLTGNMQPTDILPALWVSAALTAMQSALCVAGIRKKQL